MRPRPPSTRFVVVALSLTAAVTLGERAVASTNQPATISGISYPLARRGDTVDDYHGIKVADPYRWLEQLDSPETRAWVLAEARLTDACLGRVPERQNLKRRLTELLDFERYGIPFHQRDRYFYTHNTGLQPQSVLDATTGLAGTPSVVFDPNALSTNGSVAVVGYVVSPDAATLAYGLCQGGSDWTDWHFRDLASGKDLPDVLRWTKYYHPVFASDS